MYTGGTAFGAASSVIVTFKLCYSICTFQSTFTGHNRVQRNTLKLYIDFLIIHIKKIYIRLLGISKAYVCNFVNPIHQRITLLKHYCPFLLPNVS